MNWADLTLLVFDVDGVLTDGRVFASSAARGAPLDGKSFHTQDGAALQRWRQLGGKVAWISGRSSPSVEQRALELSVDWCRTGVADKLSCYQDICKQAKVASCAVVYVGDDLPDLAILRACAFPVAVFNASPSVKRVASYVTRRPGGYGAVAEVVEFILRKQHRWKQEGSPR